MMEMDESVFLNGRIPGRTYFSEVFKYKRPHSRDIDQPARNIWQVFDCPDIETTIDISGDKWVSDIMGKRRQIKVSVAREAGNLKELVIQRENPDTVGSVQNLLTLNGEDIARFLALIRNITSIDPSDDLPHHIDSAILERVLSDNETLKEAYRQRPNNIRELVEDDPKAKDVKAVQARKNAVSYFERLMKDAAFMTSERNRLGKNGNLAKPESVWQNMFQENQWILGAGLGAPLFTAYDSNRLETIVRGNSFNTSGKRTDALYTTSGIIKSFVFAEIKTPDTKLLEENKAYRPGTWSASKELAGGIAQVHTTVQLTEDEIVNHVKIREDENGDDIPRSEVFMFRPRAYLVIGSTAQFQNERGGKNRSKIRSFELLRASMMIPEIITYDELLAKAKWLACAEEE